MRFLLYLAMLFWFEQALAQVPATSQDLFQPEYWIVEKTTPKTQVAFEKEYLEVSAKGGITLWYHEPLEAPVSIRLQAKVVTTEDPVLRVSDLNFFWMAQDPEFRQQKRLQAGSLSANASMLVLAAPLLASLHSLKLNAAGGFLSLVVPVFCVAKGYLAPTFFDGFVSLFLIIVYASNKRI